MLTFKDFIAAQALYEDIFVKGDELLAAVNTSSTVRKPSTPTSISTNLRPLGRQTGLTRGLDVWYAFSYKPSDETGGSTDLLKSFKGKGPFKFTDARREKFIDDTTTHMASEFKKMNRVPDVIVTPQSSSVVVAEFATALAKKLGVQSAKIGAFKKADAIQLPEDKEKALTLIQSKYIDLDYILEKFKGDDKQIDVVMREISLAVYRSIKKHGHIVAKELPKMFSKFVKNIVDNALEGDDQYILWDKDVMVVDDVLSSGATMSDLFRACKDLLAAKVWGCTLFARTSAAKEAE
jgi:adenine/guanine phosphoribosyltransferase-like PRPP-binding protein